MTQQKRFDGQTVPKLSMMQKIMAVLTLIGFGIIAFFMAGVVLTLFLALVVVGLIAAGVRWVWCKVTGKPFIPGIRFQAGQAGPAHRAQRGHAYQRANQKQSNDQSKTSNTIEGEYTNVDK